MFLFLFFVDKIFIIFFKICTERQIIKNNETRDYQIYLKLLALISPIFTFL
jgi:uncharacterized protein involved in response to NO